MGVVWLAAVLRFHGLFANRFHADEALFAGWARLIAVWRDPLLQTQAVDKPPLLFYLQALSYPLFGPVEWAARLPNLVASLLLIPLTAVLAWRVSGRGTAAVVAALFLALTPLTIQFSATAFIDPLLTAFLLVACLLVVRPSAGSQSSTRPTMAGICFGLAVATKYQAWLFLPLIVALGWSGGWSRREWRRWLMGFAPIAFLLIAWTAARSTDVNLWSQQMTNFGGLRLAWSWELWPRLLAWARLWVLALGLPFVVTTSVVAAVGRMRLAESAATDGKRISGWLAEHYPLLRSYSLPHRVENKTYESLRPSECWLWLFILAYSLLHWLLAVPVWDRYLLPLMPFVAVLVGNEVGRLRAAILLNRGTRAVPRTSWFADALRENRRTKFALIMGFILLQLPVALAARQGHFPIGGQPTADQGAAEIGQYLADAPYGTVLYDHWYSWHWRYHFFDRGVYVSWFPHPQALVDDLRVFGQQTAAGDAERYVVLPAAAVAQPVIRAVEEAGFHLQPVYRAAKMILYQIDEEQP